MKSNLVKFVVLLAIAIKFVIIVAAALMIIKFIRNEK